MVIVPCPFPELSRGELGTFWRETSEYASNVRFYEFFSRIILWLLMHGFSTQKSDPPLGQGYGQLGGGLSCCKVFILSFFLRPPQVGGGSPPTGPAPDPPWGGGRDPPPKIVPSKDISEKNLALCAESQIWSSITPHPSPASPAAPRD